MKRINILLILVLCIISTVYLQAQFTVPRILKHPQLIKTERLNVLNSTFRETNINITPDGKYMFFMSGRGQMPWSNPNYHIYKGKMEADGDIWFSKKVSGIWQYPTCLGQNVNTDKGEDEPNISPDGQKVYFQSWRDDWILNGGPYYESSLNGSLWGVPKGLGGGISQFFKDLQVQPPFGSVATDGATMSADGKTFIVAAGKDYDAELDLYISRKNAYGYWTYPVKLPISTIGDERSPFLAGDGKTLYFASDGYGGWGGLDILKTTLKENGSCGEVVNLGSPFNTWLDDYGFILTASGNEAYFVREGDIYFADTKEANPELKPDNSTLMIEGIVISAKTKRGMSAEIKIIHPVTKALIASGSSNSLTGEYAILLPLSELKFIQQFSKTGFIKEEKNFAIQLKPGMNEIESNAELKPLEEVKKEEVVVINVPKKKDMEAAADIGLPEIRLK